LAYTLTSEIEWMTWLVAGRLNPVKLSFRWVHGHVHTWQCKMEGLPDIQTASPTSAASSIYFRLKYVNRAPPL
jgi:hypothetical protein